MGALSKSADALLAAAAAEEAALLQRGEDGLQKAKDRSSVHLDAYRTLAAQQEKLAAAQQSWQQQLDAEKQQLNAGRQQLQSRVSQ